MAKRQPNLFLPFLFLLVNVLLLPSFLPLTAVRVGVQAQQQGGGGGNTRKFNTKAFDRTVSHRQNLCDRYDAYRNNDDIDGRDGGGGLKNALRGLNLTTLFFADQYFPYPSSDEDGRVPYKDAGMLAELMDELALRAGFEWRNTFGIIEREDYASRENVTFVDALDWGVETYDIFVGWIGQSAERMARGVTFCEPWFDSSTVLIDKHSVEDSQGEISWFAFMKPFEPNVWYMIFLTVIVSGLAFQLMEQLDDERDGRGMRQWFSDNLYLSCLSLFQTFEYAPTSVSGRIFGVSMTIWSLLMTSTYTANLASMLVMENQPDSRIDSIEMAIEMDVPICTKRGVIIDENVLPKYRVTNVIKTETFLESYQYLNSGKCKIVLDQMDSWYNARVNSTFNPKPLCNMDWVGKKVDNTGGGFAVKADAGHYCTSLIRDVLNVHLKELMDTSRSDFMAKLWAKHRAKSDDGKCFGSAGGDTGERRFRRRGRRLLRRFGNDMMVANTDTTTTGSVYDVVVDHQQQSHRQLKGGGKGGGGDSSSKDSSAMSLREMAGTFLFHWILMVGAVVISLAGKGFRKIYKSKKKYVQRINRRHGPIVGPPPKLNTWVEVDATLTEKAPEPLDRTKDDHDDDDYDEVDADMTGASIGIEDFGGGNNNNFTFDGGNESFTSYGHGSYTKATVSSYNGRTDGKRTTIVASNKTAVRKRRGSIPYEQPYRHKKEEREEWRRSHDELRDRMDNVIDLMQEFLMRQEDIGHSGRYHNQCRTRSKSPGSKKIYEI